MAARQVKRLRGTFSSETKIELYVFHDGFEDLFAVDDSGAPSRVRGREVSDASTVFRRLDALVFSQEEITQLADRQASLLDFIDNLAADQLEKPRNDAREIVERLQTARQIEMQINRLNDELMVLEQEAEELRRQLSAQTTVQEELERNRAAKEAKRFIENTMDKAMETEERLASMAEDLEGRPPPFGKPSRNLS